jgi:hypothetical protein
MPHSHPSNFCLYSHSLSGKILGRWKYVSIPPLGSASPNQRFGGISSIVGNNLQENILYIANNVVCGQTCNYEGCTSPTLDAQKDRRPTPEPLCLWRSQYFMWLSIGMWLFITMICKRKKHMYQMSIWKFCFLASSTFKASNVKFCTHSAVLYLDTVSWVDLQVTRILRSWLIFLHYGKEHRHHKVTFVDYSFVQRI